MSLARVEGETGFEVHGEYAVTHSEDSLELTHIDGSARSVLVLRPRHLWLKASDGGELDRWTICNVWVDGEFLYLAHCRVDEAGFLAVDLETY